MRTRPFPLRLFEVAVRVELAQVPVLGAVAQQALDQPEHGAIGGMEDERSIVAGPEWQAGIDPA